ncbi:hypothetical protein ACH4LN_18605 [Streptomyces albus]|uniref:hypothetical protein n=1 Tax=Streptomyces TaxID=1883 RepID=UPI00034E2320|nr:MULTISPECIES: hypothetical protein [Streptomyces]EPD95122.1 hypothetical protein HMPREF1486_01902 [Streptomyces sp. HPH0547]QID36192.1 hypothetical protein G3260_002311 [Streptomyces albus]UVN56981.1 hypothetical protein NR995_22555 [Streptomyces albus]GHJ21781.1 hypothetical protein TPA0909_33950 [Streptomyces albus]
MQRNRVVAASLVAFCCVLVGALLVAREAKDGRFKPLCRGAVQEETARLAIGGGGVETVSSDDSGSPRSDGLSVECEARAEDRSRHVTFSVGDSDFAPDVLDRTLHDNLFTGDISSPLGAEWPGTFTVESPGIAHATVVLKCSSGEHDYLLLNVKSLLSDAGTYFSRSKKERLRLAQAAASMSSEADRQWKCGAQLGKKIRQAPADPLRSHPEPLSEATGTCRSMRQLAPIAGKWGITQAIGTELAEKSTTQDCLLINDKGKRVYRLSALSGPLAQGYRSSSSVLGDVQGKAGREEKGGGWAWASAQCPQGEPTALFTAASTRLGEEDRVKVSADFERAMLKAFGSDMAALHGCGKPALP